MPSILLDLMKHIDGCMGDNLYYSAFGELIETNYPLENLPAKAPFHSTLRFTVIKEDPLYFNEINCDPLYKFLGSYNVYMGVNKPLTIYRYKDGCLARFSELADFYIYNHDIILQKIDTGNNNLIDIYFWGVIFSLWFELHSIPALHASAIELNDQAVAFLSLCQSGKSTMAASFMQSGYSLLTDDLLPIERFNGSLVGRPGYPQMKMWPEAALHLLGRHQDLKLVDPNDPLYTKVKVPVGPNGFGTFCSQPRPLAAIYLPFRQQDEDGEIRIEPVSPGEAIIELIRYSFIANIVENLGLQTERLSFFARLVKEVPIRRLTYPSGFHNLTRVQDAILDDLKDTC